MPTLKDLQQEVEKIKQRNQRVELDKAWETSLARKIILLILTYLVVVIFFLITHLPDPFANAAITSLTFIISSLTIPLFKKWWLKNK